MTHIAKRFLLAESKYNNLNKTKNSKWDTLKSTSDIGEWDHPNENETRKKRGRMIKKWQQTMLRNGIEYRCNADQWLMA